MPVKSLKGVQVLGRIKGFEGIYQEPPGWYASAGGLDGFRPASFHHSLDSALSSMSAMYSSPGAAGAASPAAEVPAEAEAEAAGVAGDKTVFVNRFDFHIVSPLVDGAVPASASQPGMPCGTLPRISVTFQNRYR